MFPFKVIYIIYVWNINYKVVFCWGYLFVNVYGVGRPEIHDGSLTPPPHFLRQGIELDLARWETSKEIKRLSSIVKVLGVKHQSLCLNSKYFTN